MERKAIRGFARAAPTVEKSYQGWPAEPSFDVRCGSIRPILPEPGKILDRLAYRYAGCPATVNGLAKPVQECRPLDLPRQQHGGKTDMRRAGNRPSACWGSQVSLQGSGRLRGASVPTLTGCKIVFVLRSHSEPQVSDALWLSPLQQVERAVGLGPLAWLRPLISGSNGRLGFLKLLAFSADQASEHLAEDLHCVDSSFGIRDAPFAGDITWHTCLTLIWIMGTAFSSKIRQSSSPESVHSHRARGARSNRARSISGGPCGICACLSS
jgi:hypothetical protein